MRILQSSIGAREDFGEILGRSCAEDLGENGDGVIVVSVVYEYVPFFTNFIVDEIDMTETAFLRGRKSAILGCTDCPE